AYGRYDFPAIVQLLANFCSVDLGSLYLDVTKDRLYTMREDSRGRRSAQSAMYRIAEAFARWIAPILTFTAEEVWSHLPAETADGPRAGNVLFATWYDGLAPTAEGAALGDEEVGRLLARREKVAAARAPMRAAGGSVVPPAGGDRRRAPCRQRAVRHLVRRPGTDGRGCRPGRRGVRAPAGTTGKGRRGAGADARRR